MRKVDIGRWSSPIAKAHRINRIPQVWLHEGKKLKTKRTRDVMSFLERSADRPTEP